MSSLNQCNFVGRMGRDPEVRMTPSGSKVAQFSIACTEKFKDRNGQSQEKTEWINVVAWKNLAEIIERIGRKGQLVLISGAMQTQTWDDPNGVKKSKTEIIARQWQILNDPNFNSQSQQENYNAPDYNDVPPSPTDDELPF
jgi:single-strand DNA-binding protein